MVCVYCGGQTAVVNSRPQKRNNQVWRRRKCLRCAALITTIEVADYSTNLLVETSSGFKPFLADKLYTEVLLAVEHRKNCYSEARELTNTIIKQLLSETGRPVFTSKQISAKTLQVLARFDKRAWHRYSAERSSL